MAVIRLAEGGGTAEAGGPPKDAGSERVVRAAEEEAEAVGEPIVLLSERA